MFYDNNIIIIIYISCPISNVNKNKNTSTVDYTQNRLYI